MSAFGPSRQVWTGPDEVRFTGGADQIRSSQVLRLVTQASFPSKTP
jgi:hypothetical protein